MDPYYKAIDYQKMQHTEEFLEQHAVREKKRLERKAASEAPSDARGSPGQPQRGVDQKA